MTESPEKIRLFTALKVPPECIALLTSLPHTLQGRWLHGDDLHITLRFLGDIEPDRLDEITAALQKVRRPSFGVELSGLGTFRLKNQTVLWAGVQSTRKLTALAGDINEALAPLGFDMPVKPYVPHVTLARLKTEKGLADYISRHEKKTACHWQAGSFSLYHSVYDPEKDSKYSNLHTFPLKDYGR